MNERDTAWLRHQQQRWMRPDAHRWLRPDAARFLKPGTDPASVYPALARKYSPSQPRVPAGNGLESGRWTDEGISALARPMGHIPVDKLFNSFDEMADDPDLAGVQLAGEIPPGIGHNAGPPSDPPEIPPKRPDNRSERMRFVKNAARWLARASGVGIVLEAYMGAIDHVAWLEDYKAAIQSYGDPPKSLEELQQDVANPQKGYQIHHIVEQSPAQWFGISRSEIDHPANLVRIPTLKHYEITGWYGKPNKDFGGLSPREYLSDKSLSERLKVGRSALIDVGVLKP